jgi:hypothetical protein
MAWLEDETFNGGLSCFTTLKYTLGIINIRGCFIMPIPLVKGIFIMILSVERELLQKLLPLGTLLKKK